MNKITALDIPNQAMRAIRTDAARRVVAYAQAGQTDLAPDVMHEDVGFYTDPVMYARECQKLFRETPLLACLSQDLPEPGSYRLFDETGVPILVWRGKDGTVRAFLNICGHRGARVAREACGKAQRLTCRFHGWTYEASGSAVGVPEEQAFCGKIDTQKKLIPIPAEERHGMVFVKATPGSTMDLDAHLGGFGAELDALEFGQATRVIEDEFRTPSNWKYALDTNFENYHLPVLHGETLARVFAHHLTLFDTWGPHHRFTFPHATIYEWMKGPENEWPVGGLPFLYFLFPNVNIAIGSVTPNGGLFSISRLFPTAVGELVTKVAVYAPQGVKSPEHLADIEKSFASIKRAIRDEDYSVTGESWSSFAMLPAGTKLPIGRHEIGVQNFHRNVRKYAEA